MKNPLHNILELLKKNKRDIKIKIPEYWNFPSNEAINKTVIVNPYNLLINVIDNFILNKEKKNIEYQNPLRVDADPVVYGTFIRTTTAYDFDGDNKLSLLNTDGMRETGTILRMFLLLPYLKKIGINMIYLLPITRSSAFNKKGEAPSPYSVKNFLMLDEYLHDPMLGEYSENLLDLQFRAFVYACHILDIKVVLDFIPRTASRDNDLIIEHPDWFYWIEKDYEAEFRAPFVPGINEKSFLPEYTKTIYESEEVKKHLKKFTLSPDKLNEKKWEKLVKKIKNEKINKFLTFINNEFKITTVPGFSDVINDPQPVWKDITFLRLNFDHPIDAVKYLPKDQPPYVLFDVIKSSRSVFNKKNTKLRKYLADIIPVYQKKFGIDGARIDMGHALPLDLEKLIIQKAKSISKNTFLIAEEFDNNNSLKARNAGYKSIIGELWSVEPRWKTGKLKNFINTEIKKLSIPILATPETHDTPRAVTREGKIKFSYFTAVLNYFLPESIPFINSGFELCEIQPMNKGLDTEACNISLLSRKDLNYGKLALFNYTTLHWNTNNKKLIKLMRYCSELRNEYLGTANVMHWELLNEFENHKYCTGYKYNMYKYDIIILVNTNLKKKYKIKVDLFWSYPDISKIKVLLSLNNYLKTGDFYNTRKYKNIYKKKYIILNSAEILILGLGTFVAVQIKA